MQFYSPKYDNTGALIDGWVRVDFETDDNLYQYFQNAAALKWEVFKVNGYDLNPATDQLVYTKNLSGADLKLQNAIADRWDYSPYTRTNPAPDGLYAIRVYCRDQAGNESYGMPSYFIIDKRPPSLSILGTWRDERGNTEFGNLSSTFTAYARPGLPYDRHDSPAQDITVILHPQGYWSILADTISATFPVTYADNVANNADGTLDPNRTHDGLADPVYLSIPEIDFTAKFGNLWSLPVPDDDYTVEYIARDKAGNEYKQWDQSRVIKVIRLKGTIPSRTEIKGGEGTTVIDPINGKQDNTFNQITVDPAQQKNSGIYTAVTILGNTEATVQIIRQDAGGTGYTSLAGIRVRSADGSIIDIVLTQDNRILVIGPNGTITVPGTFIPPNTWLRVVRDGSYIKTYVSMDGKTWTLIDAQIFGGGENITIGTIYTNNSLIARKVVLRIGFGIDPFGLLARNAVAAVSQLVLADRSAISGGNAAANGNMEFGCDSRMNGNIFGGANATLRDRAYVGGSVTLGGTLTRQNQTTVTGAITQNASVPPIYIGVEGTPAGTTPITVANGQLKTLTPGSYGDVHVYSRARLTLQAGTYYFKSFILEPDVTVTANVASGSVAVKIAENCSIADRNTISLSGGTAPKLLKFYSNQTTQFRIGCNVAFTGCITAPNAELIVNATKLPDGTSRIKGAIQAKSIRLEPDVLIDATGAF
jgi:hypothetical protein